MPAFAVITATELKTKMDAGEQFRLIDVREPAEQRTASLPGAELKPLGQIAQWAQQLPDKNEEIILHCHHGMRSERACMPCARWYLFDITRIFRTSSVSSCRRVSA